MHCRPASAVTLNASNQPQNVHPESVGFYLLLVPPAQAPAHLEVLVARVLPRQAKYDHEREDAEDTAAMTTNSAMHEGVFFAHQGIQEELQYCDHALIPSATIQGAKIVDVQPAPATLECPRVVDVGAIDDVVDSPHSPRYRVLMAPDAKRTLPHLTPNAKWHVSGTPEPA